MKKSSKTKTSAKARAPFRTLGLEMKSSASATVNERSDFSKTAQNALMLLKAISRLGPVTAGELASALKLNRTVVHRLLTTLQRQSFVIKFSNAYLVGPVVIRLAESVLPAFREAIVPTMQRLASQTKETVSCAIRDNTSWLILEQILDTSHVVHVREEIGRRFPLHLGAHGHALMSAMSDEDTQAYYKRSTVPDRIKDEIVQAKKTGYAITRSELRDGVVGIAAHGLFNSQGIPFSLAVVLPSVRESDLPHHLAPLLDAVTSIASSMR